MPDNLTAEQRIKAMSANRGRTKIERAFASALWRLGLRFFTHAGYARVHGVRLIGSPDLIFPRKHVVVFLDGCFWHGCPVCGRAAKAATPFWQNKIAANQERDQQVTAALEADGWTVIRVPEHEVRTKAKLAATASEVAIVIRNITPTYLANTLSTRTA